ncbi:Unknown protein [Striga hermonthica]|uniref:Zinc finger RNA-binding protein n=1 Tax=Striga hermonthica TaxID=68872 RepID=A0A9N7NDD8_STRHE|nr:Unknown protein [Striga hermonthica]
MDFRFNAGEMPTNPNPNPNPYPSTAEYPPHYTYNFNYNYYQPAGVDSHSKLLQSQPQPPPPGIDTASVPQHYYYQPAGVDSHLSQPRPPLGIAPAYVPQPVAVQYAQQPLGYEPQQGAANYASPNGASYFQDLNTSQAAVISPFGSTPFAVGLPTNPNAQSQRKKNGSKAKKTPIVQSVRCEVCKIDCTSEDDLNQHRLGKKHKKNLEKLKEKFPVVPLPTPNPVIHPPPLPIFTSTPMDKPHIGSDLNPDPTNQTIIGPEENPEKPKLSHSQKTRKRAARSRIDDLETKRRRVLGEGATAEAVRECRLCNVVCIGDAVLASHLAGQKHASMVKMYGSRVEVASAIQK